MEGCEDFGSNETKKSYSGLEQKCKERNYKFRINLEICEGKYQRISRYWKCKMYQSVEEEVKYTLYRRMEVNEVNQTRFIELFGNSEIP